VVNFTNSAA